MSRQRARQRGIALIGLLAVLAIGATWFLVRQLNAESSAMPAIRTNRNAEVLNRAKQALIGYVAAQAAHAGENRPGALPCPEAAADYNVAASEGSISYPCTLPKVGRFPWRSLGLDKLVDASGEPLWYAVASGWAGASTVINSNCANYSATGLACQAGRLTVDGVTDDVIALIFAPGPAFNVAAGAGCSAFNQARPTTGTPDWRNYLECENATYPTPDASFVTTGPSGSFNDQVIKITVADLMPPLEAAIADRIAREIVPDLQTVYTPAGWGFSGTKPVYPYAAPFSNPSTSGMGGATSTVYGTPSISSGLLPLATSETSPGSHVACTASASAPLCQPNFVAWSSPTISGAGMLNPNCTATSGATLVCNFYRSCFLICGTSNQNYTITATIANLGMALRVKNASTASMTNVAAPLTTPTVTIGAMSSAGTAPFTISGTTETTAGSGLFGALGSLLCGIGLPLFNTCKTETITIPMQAVLSDHPLLDASTTGWFIRNKWHELTFYAVVQGHTPAGIATTPGCIDSPPASVTCLSVANVAPSSKLRAILILAGRSINGSARPSSTLADYLEFGNANATTVMFEKQPVSLPVAVSFADTGSANAFLLTAASPLGGKPLQFKAANASTSSTNTLQTPSTGTLSLFDATGAALAAGTFQANAAVQVDFDGSRFLLAKRPFNDRIIVVDSNP